MDCEYQGRYTFDAPKPHREPTFEHSALLMFFQTFVRVCETRKLEVNVVKSKVMRCSNYVNVDRINVRLNGTLLEKFIVLSTGHRMLDGKVPS